MASISAARGFCRLVEVDRGNAEALGDPDEIGRRLEFRGEQALAVEQRLLLVHQAERGVVHQHDLDD